MAHQSEKAMHSLEKTSKKLTEEELMKKVQDYRKSNFELLANNRQLAIQAHGTNKVQQELYETKESLAKLKSRVRLLERNPQQSLTQEITKLVRQLSSTSSSPVEEVELNQFEQPCFSGQVQSSLHQSEPRACVCGAANKLAEVTRLNHLWQQDFNSLNDKLKQEHAKLEHYEKELQRLQNENKKLQEQLEFKQNSETSIVYPPSYFSNEANDIEAIKQQLVIFREDYEITQKELQECKGQLGKVKLDLERSKSLVTRLRSRNTTVSENYERVSHEKQSIISELQRLSASFPPQLPFRRPPGNRDLDEWNFVERDGSSDEKSESEDERTSRKKLALRNEASM